MKTKLTESLGIKYPIIQGAMAWVSEAELAAAVSNAGGLGTIATAGQSAEWVENEIRKAKSLTDKPFAVNIVLMADNKDEIVEVILKEKPAVVTLGAGNPVPYMESLKAAGIKVVPVVPNLKLAKRVQDHGADALVIEGMEAGGHIGFMTTFTLIPQLAAELNIPIIAAGGIYSGATMLAAEVLGASGIQMGTAFLATEECPAHPDYKEKVVKGKSSQITIIGTQAGFPTRLFQNSMTRKYTEAEKAGADPMELEHFTLGALSRAVKTGDVQDGSVMAGLVAGSIHEMTTVPKLLEKMMEEYQATKQNLVSH